MARLDGKVAVITGGASGIGEATVRLFVAEGARVVVADVQDERGRRLAKELGGGVAYYHTDVLREDDVRDALAHAVAAFGRLDCVFSNAGILGPGGPIASIPVEGFDAAIGVMLRGAFLGMKHAAPIMTRQGSGSIISTASVAGLRAGYGGHPYNAAKAGIIHLTHSVAMELGEAGVRVNCICPGGIATPIFGRAAGLPAEAAERTVEPIKMTLADGQPIRRSGLAEDIARAALWLASDEASFVNGHALVVDGGLIGGRLWSKAEARSVHLMTALGVSAGVGADA